MSIENSIMEGLEGELPFVLYRKENESEVTGYFQQSANNALEESMHGPGFVFAPFNNAETPLFIPFDAAIKLIFEIEKPNPIQTNVDVELGTKIKSKDHINLVKKGIDFIKNSDCRKVVLARKENTKVKGLNVASTFLKLCSNYPNAYVYIWYHPKSGIWMGATPERLLSLQNNKFNVMALASTQEYEGSLDVEWGEKEQQEHQFVVDYITDKIQDYSIEVSRTYTVKAGNLLHLRADINGVISSESNMLNPLIKALHPTPATCGLPKELAKEFIIKNEGFNREFYTGYLGEIYSNSADLYVNLRCMKVSKDLVSIFVGGGITKDSKPEKEWLETVAKAKVMRRVL